MLIFLEGGDSESYHSKNKAKRVRTTFTEEQLQVLQANFQLDSNPDGQDLERIAQITGLSKRVTQVWFQNSRARQKKHLHTGKVKNTPSGLRMYSHKLLKIIIIKGHGLRVWSIKTFEYTQLNAIIHHVSNY